MPVDPLFDGHPERPFHDLTADEKLDWIWECMQLLHLGRKQRGDLPQIQEPTPPDPPMPSR